MPVDYADLLRVILDVCRKRNAKMTITGSIKGGLLAGGGAMLGGMLGGPLGILLGAVAGGGLGAASQNFKPLLSVIQEDLNDLERQELCTRVARAISTFGPQDAVGLSLLMMAPNEQIIINTVRLFFSEVRHSQITFDGS